MSNFTFTFILYYAGTDVSGQPIPTSCDHTGEMSLVLLSYKLCTYGNAAQNIITNM